VVTRLKRQRGIIPPKRKDDYKSYLTSKKWKAIRERVLQAANNRCRACGNIADQVHHMSYDAPVMEGFDDSKLVPLCRTCHKWIEFDKKKKVGLKKANARLAVLLGTT
jgi:hypothetical protein